MDGCKHIVATISRSTRFSVIGFHDEQEVPEIILDQPTTAFSLLNNFKIAMDERLFLDPGSFTDETISRVTGGKQVRISKNKERGWITAMPTKFEHFIKDLTMERNGRELTGIQLRIRYVSLSEENLKAYINVSFRESQVDLSFENVLTIFGSHWHDNTPKFMAPGQNSFDLRIRLVIEVFAILIRK